jgi:hypothetical protein
MHTMRDDKSAVRLERRRDVARKLGVSESQVLKFERAGLLRRVKIPGLRAVRYDADESAALARRWIEDSKHGARGAGGAKQKMGDEPHAKRWGWLKNGNRPGDVSKAPRCGARTRQHTLCREPAMRNGRCRMHGGMSTGPRTPAGLEHSRQARWKHGARSREIREVLRANRERWRSLMALLGGSQNYARLQPGFESPTGMAPFRSSRLPESFERPDGSVEVVL